MKSLLTKFKKMVRLWRQSGFLEGTKIIFSYLKIYLKSFFIGSGDILFISNGVGNSAHYRAYNVAEELHLHKFKTAVTNVDNPRLIKMASKFDIFIFHRVVYNNAIKNLIKKIKKQKKEIIFDTDDLVYDPNFLVYMDYFKKISAVEKELYKRGIGSEIINDPYVKIATTPVEFLAEKIRQKGKKVFIVPNRLSNKEVVLAEKILKGEKKKDNFIRIGYFSGTLSHNKDFAMVVLALIKVMERYPQVKLCLAGPLEIDKSLNKFKNRVERIPFVSRDKYFKNLSQIDINMVPLELDNPFCESKSEIKFIEAGILKIPTVAVKNQTFSQAIKDGTDGFLAKETEEWIEKISRLIKNKKLRLAMGEKARSKTLKKYTNKNSHNIEYYNYLKNKCR